MQRGKIAEPTAIALGIPIREADIKFHGGIMPRSTSAETLRGIADSVTGCGSITLATILRKAAKELEDWEWLREHGSDIDSPIVVCYSEKHASLEAAIDAARLAGREG